MSSVPGRLYSRSIRRSTAPLLVSAAAALTLASAPAALAQAPTATPASAPAVAAGWQDGFFIQSANGENRIQFGAVVQADGRFTTDDPAPFTDTFTIRKARPTLQGRVAKYFDFRLTPEFGNGAATVLDAYVDTRFSNAFRVRVGKDKSPVGLEVLYADPGLLFPERSLASSLIPNRDVGVQVQGDLAGTKVSYALGVFNGIVDGSSSTSDVDTNSGKDVAGRVLLQPFRNTRTPGSVLNNLAFHIGASTGSQTGTLPSFKTSAGQTYFSYTGANANGTRTRVTPAVAYDYGHAGAFAEYARTTQRISKGGTASDITNDGWNVSGTWILTGEAASSGVIRPKLPFDPSAGHWGAVQLVARYSQLQVDREAFDASLASAGASRIAHQVTIGADWYPVAFVKYYLAYERTSFDGGFGTRPDEHSIIFRTQLAF
jgi:phosphate-selective porin OprO/OprP